MEILINTELITRKYIDEISYKIIGCAIEVHRHLGPGLLESVYEPCFIPKGLLINFHSENIIEQLVSLVTEEFAKFPKE